MGTRRAQAKDLQDGDRFLRHDIGGSYEVTVIGTPEKGKTSHGVEWVDFDVQIADTGETYRDSLMAMARVDIITGG